MKWSRTTMRENNLFYRVLSERLHMWYRNIVCNFTSLFYNLTYVGCQFLISIVTYSFTQEWLVRLNMAVKLSTLTLCDSACYFQLTCQYFFIHLTRKERTIHWIYFITYKSQLYICFWLYLYNCVIIFITQNLHKA